jgi:hypothetical protein
MSNFHPEKEYTNKQQRKKNIRQGCHLFQIFIAAVLKSTLNTRIVIISLFFFATVKFQSSKVEQIK